MAVDRQSPRSVTQNPKARRAFLVTQRVTAEDGRQRDPFSFMSWGTDGAQRRRSRTVLDRLQPLLITGRPPEQKHEVDVGCGLAQPGPLEGGILANSRLRQPAKHEADGQDQCRNHQARPGAVGHRTQCGQHRNGDSDPGQDAGNKTKQRCQTGNTFITSSPKWLITFTAIRPVPGRGNGREVSRYSVAQASSSISARSAAFSDL